MEIMEEVRIGSTRLRVIRGDITEAPVDAIVNAANSHLQHGGGVAGAIVRKGGRVIQDESDRIGFVPVGRAAVTTAGSLPARYVIHAVGPRWGEGDEEGKLASAVRNTLALAEEKGFTSLAMPAISAGIFGFPKDRCARIIVGEIAAFAKGAKAVEGIDIYLMDSEIIGFFSKEVERLKGA
ncbi:MAG: macro domain-containing protein [Syntrophorhabdales bacterium]|jgi:O-acetyl-ADP-ribose deacetylase (regulator of RNase III)